MRITTLSLCMALLVSVACDSNPDERTLITAPRLLAVQASPPALSGLEGAIDLSALAIDGQGKRLSDDEVHYRVCSPWQFVVDPERDCPWSSALALTGTELRAQDILDFYPAPSSYGGDAGVPPGEPSGSDPDDSCAPKVLVEVPVIAELQVDRVSLLTVKRIPVYLNQTTRRNPRIDDIAIAHEEDGEHTIRIRIDPNSLDSECRDGVPSLEAIRVYLYSTSGRFENSSVDLVPTRDGRIDDAQLRWTSSGEPATLYFVAVDNNGGVTWEALSL